MNIINSFNSTIEYLESCLADDIDMDRIKKISGYSYAQFSRIFSILSDLSISEYIRNRKLTEAAFEISRGNVKIIDIAIKYGYSSQDSFGLAFKKFHNHTPSEVRAGAEFKVCSKIVFAMNIRGGDFMNIRIEKKPGFSVAGIKRENIDTKECGALWEELFSKYDIEKLSNLGNGQSYGMCYEIEDENIINYMACFNVDEIEKAIDMGLEIVQTEPAEYLILSLKGRIPDSIHAGWKYLMEVFFPRGDFMHSGKPDFEVYGAGDMYSEDFEMELWVPVIRVE